MKNLQDFLVWYSFPLSLKLYHPSRVLTLVYQPFAFATTAVLTYKEAKINTRLRNLIGYAFFFASTLSLLVVSSADLCTSWYLFHNNSLIVESNKFELTSLSLSVKVGLSHIWERRSWPLYWYLCNCLFYWSCICQCSRRNDGRIIFHAPWTHPG